MFKVGEVVKLKGTTDQCYRVRVTNDEAWDTELCFSGEVIQSDFMFINKGLRADDFLKSSFEVDNDYKA
jgi:hypothetical protein